MEIWCHDPLQKCLDTTKSLNVMSKSDKNRGCDDRASKDNQVSYFVEPFQPTPISALGNCIGGVKMSVISQRSKKENMHCSNFHILQIPDAGNKNHGKDMKNLIKPEPIQAPCTTLPSNLPCRKHFHIRYMGMKLLFLVMTIYTQLMVQFFGRIKESKNLKKSYRFPTGLSFAYIFTILSVFVLNSDQVMLSSKSLPIPMEGLKNNSVHAMTMKPSALTSSKFQQNTHSDLIHSSSVITNILTASYNHDKDQSTTHFITNSSLVIKLLGKRSTDNFPNYYSSEIQPNNRSKLNENFDRPQSINSIDRIDIDDKKLNNSKSSDNILYRYNGTVHDLNLRESERTKSANSSSNRSSSFDNVAILNNPVNSSISMNSSVTNMKDKENIQKTNKKPNRSYGEYSPPAISRKNITICVILVFCVAIAVGINFINLNSDYEDLMDFYKGYMGRRLLIVEGRLTSKSHIQELKAKEQIRIELGPQLNGGIMDETPASNFYPPSPYIGANLIANGHITNAQFMTEDTSAIFNEDGISFIPLRNWSRAGSTRDQEQHNANYGSKVRGGLARQEAVDGKGYLSRSQRVASSNRASASTRVSSINESSVDTTYSAATIGLGTNLAVPQARTPTASNKRHIPSISHSIQPSQNSSQLNGGGTIEQGTSYRTASIATAGTTAKYSHGPSPSTTMTTLAPIHKTSGASSNIYAMDTRSDSPSAIETIGEEFEESTRWTNNDDQTDLIYKSSYKSSSYKSSSIENHEYDEDDISVVVPKKESLSLDIKSLEDRDHLYVPEHNPRTRVSYSKNSNGRIRGLNCLGTTMESWETIWDIAPPSVTLCCTNFIEDQDPEWRDLDYGEDIGPPPDSFCQFMMQYDFKIFSREFRIRKDDMDRRELVRRKNLLRLFKLWKKRKQRLWSIVVTERAKKEMIKEDAANEKSKL